MNSRGRPFVPPRVTADLPPWFSRTRMACCDPSLCWRRKIRQPTTALKPVSIRNRFHQLPSTASLLCATVFPMDIWGELVRALNSLLSRHGEHRGAWRLSPTHRKTVKTELPGVQAISNRIARIELPWTVGDHDDGLDMALGRHLSQGEWLGPYNQFTLLKGPGYPAFLAVVSWLGISVSLAHALFHCAAISLFLAVCRRFIRSVLLSSLMFAFLLWHPIALTAPMLRVSRSTIYHGQVLIFLALAAHALFGVRDHKRGAFFGCLSGAVLAWLWLTREEGISLVPGVVILTAAAAFGGFRERTMPQLAVAVTAMALTFATVQLAFNTVNWHVYGKFVGIDVKEANFQNALRALNGVVAGEVQPFVAVTRQARQQIYSVSPAFSSLAGYLDGPPAAAYREGGCRPQRHMLPVPCGEIVAGWFLWALRDAAAWAGYYSSPASTSNFFGEVAREINSACARGLLECRPQMFAEMPRVTDEQIALIPARYLDALDMLMFREAPDLDAQQSRGDEDALSANLEFLNYPRHTRSKDIARLVIVGWYYKSGQEWISARVKTPEGLDTFGFERVPSPDIADYFHDQGATAQRFVIRTTCGDECLLELSSPDGSMIQKPIAELLATRTHNFRLGAGTVQVESIRESAEPGRTPGLQELISHRVRQWLLASYAYVSVPLVVFGLAAFAAAGIRHWKHAALNACFVMAFVCWMLSVIRITLLVIVEATWFPALEFLYLAPIYFLTTSGAFLSIAAWAQLARNRPDGDLSHLDIHHGEALAN